MPLSTVRPPYSPGPSAEDWVAFLPKYVLPALVEPYLPVQSRPPGRPHKHRCPFKKENSSHKQVPQSESGACLVGSPVNWGTTPAPISTQGLHLMARTRQGSPQLWGWGPRDRKRLEEGLGESRNSPGSVCKVQFLHTAKGRRAAPSGRGGSPPTQVPPSTLFTQRRIPRPQGATPSARLLFGWEG